MAGGEVRRSPLVLAAGLLCLRAQADDVAGAPAKPLTPGSVALLVEHGSEPATRDVWAAALKDPRPEVRAAAARVIDISGAPGLSENLKRALVVEDYQEPASEEMLALSALDGEGARDALLSAAKRMGSPGALAAATALARVLGPAALSSLPALRAAGLKDYAAFFGWATRQGTKGLTAAGSVALRDRDAVEWQAVLGIARKPGASLDPGVILASLGDLEDGLRGATWWHLALVKTRGGKLDARVEATLSQALDEKRPTDPRIGLPIELLSRLLGRRPVMQNDWIAALGSEQARAPFARELAGEPRLLAQLERDELEALSAAVLGDSRALGHWLEKGARQEAVGPPADAVRTVGGLPRGFVAGVLESAGCDPQKAHGLGAAQVTYGADGRPQQVGVMTQGPGGPLGQPPACEEAARVLLATALRGEPRPTARETLLLVLESDSLGCLAEEPPVEPLHVGNETPAEPVRDRDPARIKEPRKIKNVNPVYPRHAKEAWIHGTVVLDATISPTGCVKSVEVAQSVPGLDVEAIRAVAQWRYTPTLLNGSAVPVIMTVTVNFQLR
jgi:TonB family protein